MPVLKRPDGEIHYEEYGQGYPILLFAPGGMRSRAEMWHAPAGGPPRPWSDWTQSLAGGYRVIAMDQRNAGRSRTDDRGRSWLAHLRRRSSRTDGPSRLLSVPHIGRLHRRQLLPQAVRDGARPHHRRGVAEPDRAALRTIRSIFRRVLSNGRTSRRRSAHSSTTPRLPRSARICGTMTSCSASAASSAAAARCRPSCFPASTNRIPRSLRPNSHNCCRASRCWRTGAARSI